MGNGWVESVSLPSFSSLNKIKNNKNFQTMIMTEKMPGNVSTVCGSLVTVLVAFNGGDIVKTVVLGGIGTVVSYIVSRVMKRILEYWET